MCTKNHLLRYAVGFAWTHDGVEFVLVSITMNGPWQAAQLTFCGEIRSAAMVCYNCRCRGREACSIVLCWLWMMDCQTDEIKGDCAAFSYGDGGYEDNYTADARPAAFRAHAPRASEACWTQGTTLKHTSKRRISTSCSRCCIDRQTEVLHAVISRRHRQTYREHILPEPTAYCTNKRLHYIIVIRYTDYNIH